MLYTVRIIILLGLAIVLAGCGSGGGGNGYLIGNRLGEPVYMQPGPPAYSFTPWSGTTPGIRVDNVVQFASTIHPSGTGIYEPTTQVAFGQITGPTTGVQVIVYSQTNGYYIQPLTSTTIIVRGDSTWIAPAHAGSITALLVRAGYSLPDITSAIPAVDGVNVLAEATQP